MEFRCRCCGNRVSCRPVLKYRNMPARAQHFPEASQVKSDQGADMDIYQCPLCGLVQIMGEPVPYYRDVIRAVGVSEEMKAFREKYFAEFVHEFRLAGKRIVEIGAGNGEFMEMMASTGARVYGLENNPEAVQAGKDKGLDIIQGFPDTPGMRLPGGPYDGFYMMHFLEHIPEPNSFLQSIAGNLTEDGVGLVEVPNMDYIMEKHIFSEFMLDHLSYFTQNTLSLLLNKNGFQVERCRVIWNGYIISAVVRRRREMDTKGFLYAQESLVAQIRAFVKNAAGRGEKVAVWGAGHEALALLALTGLSGEITMVVDSARFKQGKFTPSSHIPVQSPEKLKEANIDTVLVMVGSYTSEVTGILKASCPFVKIGAVMESEVITL